ncbi:MAG: hypothetical protein HY657_10160 [Acidobacteria bacterium]|nr:hypothetical protein [Acidobacteriota bacterium]
MACRGLVLVVVCALLGAALPSGQTPSQSEGVAVLLEQLEAAVQAGDRDRFAVLFGPAVPPDQIQQFGDDLLRSDLLRAQVRERDRVPLDGALPGDGYRLVVELFAETARRARILTALIDVRRPSGGGPGSWRITGTEGLTAVEGLYRLAVNASTQYSAQNLTIEAEDLQLTLQEGDVFLVEGDEGVTGLVLLGRGVMRFAPAPETEKGQLRIFSGGDTLTAPFDTAFVRVSPSEYEARVDAAGLAPVPLNPRQLRRAQDVLAREGPKSFSLDLNELSPDVWYLLPPPGDLLAEVRTRRHGTLTYSRSGAQAEDITLFDRERRRTIALYPSAQRLAARGRSYSEDDLRDYDVLDYDIEATVSPERQSVEGRARLRLRVRSFSLSTLTLRLADSLAITAVASAEYGRLLHLRIRSQNSVIVNLPAAVGRDTELTLLVAYSGTIEPQSVDAEGLQAGGQGQDDAPLVTPERSFLLSNRSFWYPQNPVSDYATATLRITVPEGYGCVASGAPRTGTDVTLRDLLTLPASGTSSVFTASEPLRYLAVVVSRFVRVGESTIDIADDDRVRIAIDANPRQQARGRALMGSVEDIVRFYAGLLGDAPYPSATVALVEDELPGGHSPGYFAVLNAPLPYTGFTWRNDPAAFPGFPDFFLAHELAHQWWGQAIGWRNYHEQWISEGFAQYFAALYARQTRGEQAFVNMLRQFRRWSVAEADEGPISLGYRLGHIKGDTRVLRALVYNKGAAVLHMLRGLLGDDTFFNGLRHFYTEQKFQKTGTEDLRRAFEAEAGRSLERFFERWIYGAAVPRLRYATSIGSGAVTARFEQVGEIFDIPVTVTILYADGRVQDVVVPVTEASVEQAIPTKGVARQVQVNRDYAAVAQFQRF